MRTFLYKIADNVKEDHLKTIFDIEKEKYILYATTGTFQYPVPMYPSIEALLEEVLSNNLVFPQMGTDESGKGDVFGPLVVAGAIITKNDIKGLIELGIKDSKKITNKSIDLLKKEVLKRFTYEVVLIAPPKYNELHEKMHNVNRILAWGHARVIENLLSRRDAGLIIVDKFANTDFIKSFLFKKAKTKDFIIEPRAEKYLATALASIIARIYFLEYTKEMEKKYKISFPQGAGKEAEKTLKEFIKKYGKETLKEVAKLHFKNVNEIIKGGK